MPHTKRTIGALSIVLVLLLIAVFTVRPILLGGMQAYTLPPAPALTGQVSQALATNTTGVAMPVAGQDYNLENTQYFLNDTWAVSTIVPTNEQQQSGMVVLHKQNGLFTVVLGPGSSFPPAATDSLPSVVANYIGNGS